MCLHRQTTVSYTHLDVYKRQPRLLCLLFVSYVKSDKKLPVTLLTNRDVYKRQIMEIVEDCMRAHRNIENPTLQQILDTEKATYERIESRR